MAEAFTDEYADIRTAATAAMRDACKIGVRGAPTGNDPGNITYTYGSAIACGLEVKTRAEVANGSQATITTAVLRLPWGTTVTTSDRVQMTSRAGATVSEYYAVDGAPFQHIACVRVNLKRLTGASDL